MDLFPVDRLPRLTLPVGSPPGGDPVPDSSRLVLIRRAAECAWIPYRRQVWRRPETPGRARRPRSDVSRLDSPNWRFPCPIRHAYWSLRAVVHDEFGSPTVLPHTVEELNRHSGVQRQMCVYTKAAIERFGHTPEALNDLASTWSTGSN
jgi:hypothetical protein